jgi:hypothetical protein
LVQTWIYGIILTKGIPKDCLVFLHLLGMLVLLHIWLTWVEDLGIILPTLYYYSDGRHSRESGNQELLERLDSASSAE